MAYNAIKLRDEKLKLLKKLDDRFVAEVQELFDRTEITLLEAKLKDLARHAQAVASQKASDNELMELLEQKKELEAPYKEQLSSNRAKTRLVGILLQELRNYEE